MRNEAWLKEQMEYVLGKYFSGLKMSNPLEIKFGREAKYRFGSIKLLKPKGRIFNLASKVPQKSIITITAMFAKEAVPAGVVRYTIAHELCHYAHGFSSTNRQLFRHPHHGGIINKELRERGADELIPVFKNWLKDYREQILATRVSDK